MTTPMKAARLAAGFTAIRLAENAGTQESRVYAIERGRFRPRPNEAQRLASALGGNVRDIFPNLPAPEPRQ